MNVQVMNNLIRIVNENWGFSLVKPLSQILGVRCWTHNTVYSSVWQMLAVEQAVANQNFLLFSKY